MEIIEMKTAEIFCCCCQLYLIETGGNYVFELIVESNKKSVIMVETGGGHSGVISEIIKREQENLTLRESFELGSSGTYLEPQHFEGRDKRF